MALEDTQMESEDRPGVQAAVQAILTEAYNSATSLCQGNLSAYLPSMLAINEVIQQTFSGMRRSARTFLYEIGLPMMVANGALDWENYKNLKENFCHWRNSSYDVHLQPVAQLMKLVYIVDVNIH